MTAGFVQRSGQEKDPSSYKCLRCQYQAVTFVKEIPYCADHRTDKPKTETPPETSNQMAVPTTPKGGKEMTADTGVKKGKETAPSTTKATSKAPAEIQPQSGNWVVRAKDGSDIRSGFNTKKEASRWAIDQVKSQTLKAGQYKILHMVADVA